MQQLSERRKVRINLLGMTILAMGTAILWYMFTFSVAMIFTASIMMGMYFAHAFGHLIGKWILAIYAVAVSFLSIFAFAIASALEVKILATDVLSVTAFNHFNMYCTFALVGFITGCLTQTDE